jgi:hypothetical protein
MFATCLCKFGKKEPVYANHVNPITQQSIWAAQGWAEEKAKYGYSSLNKGSILPLWWCSVYDLSVYLKANKWCIVDKILFTGNHHLHRKTLICLAKATSSYWKEPKKVVSLIGISLCFDSLSDKVLLFNGVETWKVHM